MRHFVTLIEICMHLIRVNPGHIWKIDSTTDLVFSSIPDHKMWNNKQKEITLTELISNCFVT